METWGQTKLGFASHAIFQKWKTCRPFPPSVGFYNMTPMDDETCRHEVAKDVFCKRGVESPERFCWQHARGLQHRFKALTRNQTVAFIVGILGIILTIAFGVLALLPRQFPDLPRPIPQPLLRRPLITLDQKFMALGILVQPNEKVDIYAIGPDGKKLYAEFVPYINSSLAAVRLPIGIDKIHLPLRQGPEFNPDVWKFPFMFRIVATNTGNTDASDIRLRFELGPYVKSSFEWKIKFLGTGKESVLYVLNETEDSISVLSPTFAEMRVAGETNDIYAAVNLTDESPRDVQTLTNRLMPTGLKWISLLKVSEKKH